MSKSFGIKMTAGDSDAGNRFNITGTFRARSAATIPTIAHATRPTAATAVSAGTT